MTALNAQYHKGSGSGTDSVGHTPLVIDSDICAVIDVAIAGRRLLDHPFYRAWEHGDLTGADLAGYAEQYRHFERALPEVLQAVADQLPPGNARRLVTENLADEQGRPKPHVELFEQFASTVGAGTDATAGPAAAQLVGLYRQAAHTSPSAGLAVIAAYEVQAAQVAATKADALERHYGLTRDGVEFWAIHADLEEDHAAWTTTALSDLPRHEGQTRSWAIRSAAVWWEFLDEREAQRAA